MVKLILRGIRTVVPQVLRKRVLDLAHEGHQGIVKTKQMIRSKVWWPGIDHGCQLVLQVPQPDPLKGTEIPKQAWQDVAADLLGALLGREYLLVVVDYYSRFLRWIC